ncbi:hypothetical protein CTEN210_15982 [Chaetoceros tenuissimus]|uniref:Uncharacterized protein n=1 Tax=Chaetoceros tenuissimus TaxID=426638 RepID=A0AAD3HDR4_9STRA|nr:hypothetical protein CTEN210_15982 [Chaetoceros tenuissimus]
MSSLSNDPPTFGIRGKEAWYVGPAPEHYHCVSIFLPDTQCEIQVETVQYFPNRVPIPKSSKESLLLKSALDMLKLLKDPTPAMPALDYLQLITATVTKLAELLHRAAKQLKVHVPLDNVPTENVPTQSTPDERVEPSSPAQVLRVVSPTPLIQEGSTQHPAQGPRVESQRSPQLSVIPPQQPTPIPITQDDDYTPSQRLHRYNTRNKVSRQNALVHLLQQQPSEPSDMFFMPTVHHIFNEITGKKETLDTLLAGKFHDNCNQSLSNELEPTETTKKLAMQLLYYVATYPDAVIRFKRSDMILYIHSDATYLMLPKARTRIAGYYFLSNNVRDGEDPPLNGAVLVKCKKLDPVASSSAESETGGLYSNAQNGVPMRNDLEFLDHPQPDDGTPLVTDNASSHGLLTKLMKPKRAKEWDMRYHWLEDRIQQKQYKLIWRKGIENLADYFTIQQCTRR